MPDKKINELPDEGTMSTADADKLIFIGDPVNGKLYHGLKPAGGGGGSGVGNLQQVTTNGNETTNEIDINGASLRVFVPDFSSYAVLGAPGYLIIKTTAGGTNGFLRATNITGIDRNIELPNTAGILVISVNNRLADVSGNVTISGFDNVLQFADNAAAIAGGLPTGALYRTGDILKIVHV